MLQSLGLTINFEKTMLVPSQIINYIGARLNSLKARVFLPPERIQKLKKAVHKLKPHSLVSAHHAQHLLGLMASTTVALPHAQLKMRSLQAWLLHLFGPLRDDPEEKLLVTSELARQLR